MRTSTKHKAQLSVFISWTKPLGLEIAKSLRSFLSEQVPDAEFCLSEDDIVPGKLWRPQLESKLLHHSFGIIIVTPAALTSPWIFYEAGALACKSGSTVLPVLFDVESDALGEPLRGFQALSFSRRGMERLISLLLSGEHDRDDSAGSNLRSGLQQSRFSDDAWEILERKISSSLKNRLEIRNGPHGCGNFAFYMLKMRDPNCSDQLEVHRASLVLGIDPLSDKKVAYFNNPFDFYVGSWAKRDAQVTIELASREDPSDRLFLLLKHARTWMWGVYCGLTANLSSVAGRCFIDGTRTSKKRKPGFISAEECDKEAQHTRLSMKVTEYLQLPIGPTLHCRTPLH